MPEPSPETLQACARAGQGYRARAVRTAALNYDRRRHLPPLLSLPAHEIAGTSLKGARHIVERLEHTASGLAKAARERHWSYDVNRHIAVLGALHAERAHLARLQNSQPAEAADRSVRLSCSNSS